MYARTIPLRGRIKPKDHFHMHVLVMSPTDRIADAAKPAAPADVVDCSERATDHIHEEKSEVPEVALVKVLGDSSERMCRMEYSQSGQARQHRKESAKSSVFDSVLGVGAAMNLQASERNPSPKRSPNLSPATYFVARRLAQVAGNYDMDQAPELDSQQRRLAPQPFDGKEIDHGLGSGFLEWGKEFVRQISYPECACGFSWPEDINVDVLGQHLADSGASYCTTDMCLYFKKDKDELTIVGVYVDDLLVTGTSRDAVDKFFKEMIALEIKDLGVVNKFLGLRISLDEEVGYDLDQEVSIDLLLK
uniref:Uncharacterized protein AlNc14C512G12002 n=1 Tax=Albugo laibachii Nc14 TaxID=890382 RepID=F0X0Q8_9STRA|nr:conserved hypothetical protein [Albugo laibachii Nc14]|eukprot:CCA27352.1 conserved hypothetical protein [Albugo laibachii Nc14]